MLTHDVDLLVFEPGLFKLWKIDHQQRAKGGNGTLSGTAFSAAGVNFTAAQVLAGDVIYLASIDGLLDGCYEIVEVVSSTQLTVSVLRADAADAAIAVGSGSNLIWRINSFASQRYAAKRTVLDVLELTDASVAMLTAQSLQRLRTTIAAAALVMIFEALIQQDADQESLGRKKEVYQQMLDTALARLRLEADTTGDGQVHTVLSGTDAGLYRQ